MLISGDSSFKERGMLYFQSASEDQQVGLRRAVNRLPEERPTDPTQLSRR